jgi:hypothetical protein
MLEDIVEGGEKSEAEGVFKSAPPSTRDTATGLSQVAAADTDTDRLISGAVAVEKLFRKESSLDKECQHDRKQSTGSITVETSNVMDEEMLPLTATEQDKGKPGWFGYGTSGMRRLRKWKKKKDLESGAALWVSSLSKVLNASAILQQIRRILKRFLIIGLPCIVAAFLCYYKFGRPHPDFLPEGTSLSWWLLFITRQWVTFELAVTSQYFVVEVLALRTKWVVKWMGPLVTLCVIQSRGWPLVATRK